MFENPTPPIRLIRTFGGPRYLCLHRLFFHIDIDIQIRIQIYMDMCIDIFTVLARFLIIHP